MTSRPQPETASAPVDFGAPRPVDPFDAPDARRLFAIADLALWRSLPPWTREHVRRIQEADRNERRLERWRQKYAEHRLTQFYQNQEA